MLGQFLGNKKVLYINDRHEEKDTASEDRRKLYDKRILSLLKKDDWAVFGGKIDLDLWEYYKRLGLAGIKEENIFYVDDYLNYPSLAKAILGDDFLVGKLKEENFDFIIPYIESEDLETISRKIDCKILREADFTDWINNKSNHKKALGDLNLPTIPGCSVKNIGEAKKCFFELKEQGFSRAVLKRERSVAGFGIFVIDREEDLEKYFVKENNFLMDGFVENIIFSSNIQYWVDKDRIEFLVASDQLLGDTLFNHSGNVFPSKLELKPGVFDNVLDISGKICRFLQRNKCYGIAGIDFIVTQDNQVYPTESNVRFNASTFPAFLAKELFGDDKICWKFFTFNVSPMSFRDFIEKSREVLIEKKGDFGIFPIGADILDFSGEIQLMSAGRSHEEVNKHIDELKSLF